MGCLWSACFSVVTGRHARVTRHVETLDSKLTSLGSNDQEAGDRNHATSETRMIRVDTAEARVLSLIRIFARNRRSNTAP